MGTLLEYNFDKKDYIPNWLYNKVWDSENLFEDDELLNLLNIFLSEDCYEIHRTES